MRLTDNEKEMLQGARGWALQKCMKILSAVGECYNSERLIPVTSVHIAGNYAVMKNEGIEWLEELAEHGIRVSVYTTKHPEMFDFEDSQELNVPESYQQAQKRIDEVIRSLGIVPTYSCHHFLVGNVPRFGEHIAWSASASAVYANSVIGARSNQDGDHVALAAAITGVIPEWGMHLTENRRAQVIVDSQGLNFEQFTSADYQAMGWHIGKIVQDRVPVFTNLPTNLPLQHIRAILYTFPITAFAATGAVKVVHMVGITPEAASLEAAFGGHVQPLDVISVNQRDIDIAYETISTTSNEKMDLVIFGCPQCSIQEIIEIAAILKDRKVHPDIELWICTSNCVKTLAKRMGLFEVIKKAGGRVVADIGAADGPHLYLKERGVRLVATNSARASYHMHGLFGLQTLFGSTDQCIKAAISGKWEGKV
jgi:predicted aconitase